MHETETYKEERMLRHDPRLKAACDVVGAKPGTGPCCMPMDIKKILDRVDAYDKATGARSARFKVSKGYLAEGIHASFRKATDHKEASKAHEAICRLPDDAWDEIVTFLMNGMGWEDSDKRED